MANAKGYKSHGSRGGKFARKRKIDIDFSAFEDLAVRLQELGASLEKTFGDAMEKAGEVVQSDTEKAVEKSNLPAEGKYSHGKTKESIVKDVHVNWGAGIGEMPLGFDKTLPGAGGFLITGTPKMQPDRALAAIYSDKKSSRAYEKRIKKQIEADLNAEIEKRLNGG